jgi:hypothetical protein
MAEGKVKADPRAETGLCKKRGYHFLAARESIARRNNNRANAQEEKECMEF